jgi:hypothetical protein
LRSAALILPTSTVAGKLILMPFLSNGGLQVMVIVFFAGVQVKRHYPVGSQDAMHWQLTLISFATLKFHDHI